MKGWILTDRRQKPRHGRHGSSTMGLPREEGSHLGNSYSSAYQTESQRHRRRHHSSKKRYGKTRKIVLGILAAVLLLAAGTALAAWRYYGNFQKNIALDNSSEVTQALSSVNDEKRDPYWMLILGSDSRHGADEDARSDVIMLARIDADDRIVSLVSIPRDTQVELPGHGTQKINAALQYGGPTMAIEAVGAYSGVKITHYVEFYFEGMQSLVDQVGGIMVDVPEYANIGGVEVQPGTQLLDGESALALARSRKTYSQGDFSRTDAQRIIVQAIAKKILAQSPAQMPSTISALSECFTTDMPLADIVNLANDLSGGGTTFYSAMCPSAAQEVEGTWYTFTYENQWKAMMQKAKAGIDPSIDETEAGICGDQTTFGNPLDMNEPIPNDVQQSLNDYWRQKGYQMN